MKFSTLRAVTILAATAALSAGALASAEVSKPTTAAAPALPADQAAKYKAMFELKSSIHADAVLNAPLPNFVEVDVGTKVYYMDKQGKWLFDGHLVELATRTSVSALRQQELEAVGAQPFDWKTLNLADAIKTVRGTPKPGRVIVAFEDPNCPFCKKVTPEFEKLENVAIYVFPVGVLGPASTSRAETVWCAKDHAAAWTSAMLSQPPEVTTPCDTAGLQRNLALYGKLRVNGVPTMFFADGSRISGLVGADQLEAKLGTGASVASK
jgi:thiol:disulfide interchange protein DsbC